MPGNTEPIFALTPRLGVVAIATANTGRDGSGTIGTVLTAGSNGTRITRITIKASVTTTAGMVRLFIHDGSSYFLWKEQTIAAVTPSATVKAELYTLTYTGEEALILPSGYSLRASTEKSENFNVFAEGGDF